VIGAAVLMIAFFGFGVTQCGKQPTEVQQRTSELSARIERVSRVVEALPGEYQRRLQSPEFQPFAIYAERAKWEDDLAAAQVMLRGVKERFAKEVTEVNKLDRDEDAPKVLDSIVAIGNDLQAVETRGRRPQRMLQRMRTLVDAPKGQIDQAQLHAQQTDAPVREVRATYEDVVKRHAHKKADMEQRIAKLVDIQTAVKEAAITLERELAKPTPDLLAAVEANETSIDRFPEFERESGALVKRFRSLDRSFTRTLLDMKAAYAVTIGRSSWDETSDYGEEDYLYAPKEVTPEVAADLARTNGENIGGSYAMLAGINVNEAMPPSHNASEFYIQDIEPRFYHRYLEVEGTERRDTDWILVDEDDFADHVNNQGMEIYSKPYGVYEDEAITIGSPMGYAFVGNPHYGRWGGPGNSLWFWAPRYASYNRLYDGNHQYRRDDWELWRSNLRAGRPWYGRRREDEEERYGSGGRFTRVYIGDSYWQRTGRISRWDVSFRNLGPEYRGGGPGGGGK